MNIVAFYIEISSDDQLEEIKMTIANCNARFFQGATMEAITLEKVMETHQQTMEGINAN